MKLYAATRISENILETPEGFLLCLGVPIARTGSQDYLPQEVGPGAEAGPDGMVKMDRPEAEVFRPATMASFSAKPITIDHPGEFVTPENWKALAVGVVTNVRRGEGEEDDLLLADLLITDERAISLVRAGLREVSCGYDVEYEVTGPGRGVQHNIIGNHVALVSEARCGSRCSINDKTTKENPMAGTEKKAGAMDKLARFLRLAKAMDTLDEELASEEKPKASPAPEGGEEPKDHTPEQMEALEERLERIEAAVAQLLASKEKGDEEPEAETADEDPEGGEPEGEIVGDGKGKATDKKTKALDQAVVARAEIISPGITLDGVTDACAAKRRALSRAYIGDGKALIETFTGGPVKSFKALDCATLDAAFLGVSEVMRERNNRAADGKASPAKDAPGKGKPMTVADMNKINADYWAKRRAQSQA